MNPLAALRFVLRELEAGPQEKLILLALVSYADADGACWPSVETLARGTGLGRRTVQRVLRRLEQAGLVDVTPGGGRHNPSRYRLRLPPEVEKGRQRDAVSLPEKASARPRKGVRGDTKGRQSDARTIQKELSKEKYPEREGRAAARAPSPSQSSSWDWGEWR